MQLSSLPILGQPVHCATYESARQELKRLAAKGSPSAVSVCDSPLLALGRKDPGFGKVLRGFDLVLPRGWPLVWQLNRGGARLSDRVYGAFFMRHVLRHTPRPLTHFFLGADEVCLTRLKAAALEIQPDLLIAGTFSPPPHGPERDADMVKAVVAAQADFIWVSLGEEQQERWIIKNLPRFNRGVFIAAGDAFESLAGIHSAPRALRICGLNWLSGLAKEPKRFFRRTVQLNALFLWYLLRDRIVRPATPRRRRIAFLGSRGVPARYSGFEVVVEELGSRLVSSGYDVTVYNRFPRYVTSKNIHKGMRVITLPTISTKSLDTIVHTTLSAIDAVFRGYDLIYLCGVGNSILTAFLRRFGLKVVINVDGADFRRAKWGTFARQWLKLSELWATRLGHRLIADNGEIVTRYQRDYGVSPDFINYGCQFRTTTVRTGELERWGLDPQGYVLHVSRLTPENEADLLLTAWRDYRGPLKLVITGTQTYEAAYYKKLRELADERVIFTGARFGDAYVELSQNALFFVMPAAIEATRLVLLDQMGMGKAILFKDSPATREVLGGAAQSFDADNPIVSLTEKISLLAADPGLCERLGQLALARAADTFSWDVVLAKYSRLFDDLLPERN